MWACCIRGETRREQRTDEDNLARELKLSVAAHSDPMCDEGGELGSTNDWWAQGKMLYSILQRLLRGSGLPSSQVNALSCKERD